MTTVQSTATPTTPGLKRLRASPAARRVRGAVVADQREALVDSAKQAATTAPPARQKRAQRSPSESGGSRRAAKGVPAGGKITVLDAKRTFSGATAKCWQLLRAAKTVEGYLVHCTARASSLKGMSAVSGTDGSAAVRTTATPRLPCANFAPTL